MGGEVNTNLVLQSLGPPPGQARAGDEAYANVMKANGDVSQIGEQDFKSLASHFTGLPENLQATLKQSLNTLFPGQPDKPGSAVGDALQFASDGLKAGDHDAAKNRLQDLEKIRRRSFLITRQGEFFPASADTFHTRERMLVSMRTELVIPAYSREFCAGVVELVKLRMNGDEPVGRVDRDLGSRSGLVAT